MTEQKKARERHGLSRTKEYKVWCEMRNRASNPDHPNAKYYFDKGISVCPEWDSFLQFMEDMGPRSKGTWLERIDNTQPYCKSNCKWETPSRQCSNRGREDNKSGRLGVRWVEPRGKWRASIGIDKTRHNLGYFESFEGACAAVDQAELRLLGYSRKDFI